MREIEESGKEIVKRGGDRKERGKMIEKRGYRKTSGHNKRCLGGLMGGG